MNQDINESSVIDVLKCLIQNSRVNVNDLDASNETPLGGACFHQRVNIVEILLDRADLNINLARNSLNRSPLCDAIDNVCHHFKTSVPNKSLDIVKLLLSCNEKPPIPSLIVAEQNETILPDRNLDINKTTTGGQMPLYFACNLKNKDVALLLFEKKCEREISNVTSFTVSNLIHEVCLLNIPYICRASCLEFLQSFPKEIKMIQAKVAALQTQSRDEFGLTFFHNYTSSIN